MSSNNTASEVKQSVKARVGEFSIPPIRDGLVLGTNSPIGSVAMKRALELLVSSPFAHIEIQDDTISDILVRRAILRRISQEKLVDFVLRRVKPLMGPEEILHLELSAEVVIDETN